MTPQLARKKKFLSSIPPEIEGCFFHSIKNDDGNGIRRLLKLWPNLKFSRNYRGKTGLILAVALRKKEAFDAIMEFGPDLWARDKFGITALILANKIAKEHGDTYFLDRLKEEMGERQPKSNEAAPPPATVSINSKGQWRRGIMSLIATYCL